MASAELTIIRKLSEIIAATSDYEAGFKAAKDVVDAVPVEYATDREAEKVLFESAMHLARQDTRELQKEAAKILAEADVSIFYAHLLLLEDPMLLRRIKDALAQGFTLRFALKTVADQFAMDLQTLDNELLRERLADLKDVLLRVSQAAANLKSGTATLSRRQRLLSGSKRLVVARELLPSQLIRLPLANLAGIISEQGGTTTHVAILAKALQLPMVVGVEQAAARIRQDDDLILDCSTGTIYVRPMPDIVEKFLPAIRHHEMRRRHASLPMRPAKTKDGVSVRLGGNISLISELPLLESYGATGIGLYRTEFMFMVRAAYPTEDEQYHVFRRIVEGCATNSVTIRVLDVGGDKALPYVDFGQEGNAFLGWRGIRFLLSNRDYFETHLRAILRATAHGNVNILLPMVADVEELLEAKAVLRSAQKSLVKAGIPVASDYHLGIMLEVPAAVWGLPAMMPHIDFVSVGTNDLIQYCFAVDRGNVKVARWFRQFHPVVLRILKDACDICHQHGKIISICGEMAGIPAAAPLLLGAGLRYFSMNPWKIPAVKSIVNRVSVRDCEKLLRQALACTQSPEIEQLMLAFARQHQLRLGNQDRLPR